MIHGASSFLRVFHDPLGKIVFFGVRDHDDFGIDCKLRSEPNVIVLRFLLDGSLSLFSCLLYYGG